MLYSSYISKTLRKKTRQRGTWIDTSPKMTYKWPKSSWKGVHYLWLIIRECKSKLQWDTTSYPLGWLLSKKRKITRIGKDVEKLEPLCIAGGNVTGAATVENNMMIPQKVKCRITIWSSKSNSRYAPKRIESRDSNRYLYTNFTAALFTIMSTDTYFSMDEPWQHYAQWNKPDTKGQILYEPFLWGTLYRQIHMDRKENSGCQRLKEKNAELCLICIEFQSGMMKNFWRCKVMTAEQHCECT